MAEDQVFPHRIPELFWITRITDHSHMAEQTTGKPWTVWDDPVMLAIMQRQWYLKDGDSATTQLRKTIANDIIPDDQWEAGVIKNVNPFTEKEILELIDILKRADERAVNNAKKNE